MWPLPDNIFLCLNHLTISSHYPENIEFPGQGQSLSNFYLSGTTKPLWTISLLFGRNKTQGNTTLSSSDAILESIRTQTKLLIDSCFIPPFRSHHVQTYQASNSLCVRLSARDGDYRSQVRAPTRYPSQQITYQEVSGFRGDKAVGAGLQRFRRLSYRPIPSSPSQLRAPILSDHRRPMSFFLGRLNREGSIESVWIIGMKGPIYSPLPYRAMGIDRG